MNKTFKSFGIISLLFLSFYYTNKINLFIKTNDSLYIEIIEKENIYMQSAKDVQVIDQFITPGLTGRQINIDESYNNMKKVGYFLEDLIVYDDIFPNNSIISIYDKYILGGNTYNNNASIVLKVDEDDLDSILYLFQKEDAKGNFIVDNNYEKIDEILKYGHNLLIDINISNENLKILLNKYSNAFCYFEKLDLEKLKICESFKIHSIYSMEQAGNDYLNYSKKTLSNGVVLNFKYSNELINQLPLVFDYIKYKDYNIVVIEELIRE